MYIIKYCLYIVSQSKIIYKSAPTAMLSNITNIDKGYNQKHTRKVYNCDMVKVGCSLKLYH